MSNDNIESEMETVLKVRGGNRFPFQPSDDYRKYLNDVEVDTITIPASDGDCRAYVFSAKNRMSPSPVHIYLHGGGFILEHGERDELCAAKYAAVSGGIVFDIDYKLAPEHKFPAAFNEVYDAVKWIYDNVDSFGGDKFNITISGYSAGGNLTAAIAMRANKTKEFKLRRLFLCYSPLDLATDPAEKAEDFSEHMPPERARMYNAMYLGDNADPENPYISPVYASAEMLSGLPDICIITAGTDMLKQEAHDFAVKLIENGVKVTVKCFLQARHGFMINCNDQWKEAQQMVIDGIIA